MSSQVDPLERLYKMVNGISWYTEGLKISERINAQQLVATANTSGEVIFT